VTQHGGSPDVTHLYYGRTGDSNAASLMDRLCHYFYCTWLPRWERYLALPGNIFYARLLGAENMHLGSGNRIKGISRLRIGRDFKALDHLWLEAVEGDRAGNLYKPTLVIGNDVAFGQSVHVAATNCVRIGNDVLVGSRVIITDHNHGIYKGDMQSSPLQRPADRLLSSSAETVVEDNVWIGDGVVVLPGSHIGKGSIIGANSVVNGAIPEYCMAAGIPARPIRVYEFEAKSWVPADRE
jgi:acetyltransferase-like isoleucine patch superfamily enzyme